MPRVVTSLAEPAGSKAVFSAFSRAISSGCPTYREIYVSNEDISDTVISEVGGPLLH